MHEAKEINGFLISSSPTILMLDSIMRLENFLLHFNVIVIEYLKAS